MINNACSILMLLIMGGLLCLTFASVAGDVPRWIPIVGYVALILAVVVCGGRDER